MQSLPGVANVEINADAKTATISVETGAYDEAKAMAALKDSGFPADTAKMIKAAVEAGGAAPEETSDAPVEEAESTEVTS